MKIYERIRLLRKEHLHLSQEAFGERLGVSRSVIKNIELDALARPDQKLSLIKLICKEFSINEDWLLNGVGPMFAEPETFSLDNFAKEHGATDLELEILKAYFQIDPEIRENLVEHFRNCLATSHSTAVEKAEAAYIKNHSKYVKKTDSSASNTTKNTNEIGKETKRKVSNE